MQKLTSSAPIMQHTFTQAAVYEKTTAYHMGFTMGRDCGEGERADGQPLATAEEVWTFLKGEISPKVVACTYEYDEALSLPHLPLEHQIGFIVGYLSSMFAPQAECVMIHTVIDAQSIESTGYSLDA